jgi:putative membrane protein (TIGR04086 family)
MQHQDSRPTTPAPIEPTGFFTGIQFRPIISGVVVDTLVTIVLVSAYYYGVVAKAMPHEGEAADAAFAEYWNSVDGLMMSLLLGSLGTMIGGFYAAYKAGTLEMKHGALVGIGSILLGLLLQSGGSERQTPEWFLALSLVAAIPAGALGGLFAEMFRSAFGRAARTQQGRG